MNWKKQLDKIKLLNRGVIQNFILRKVIDKLIADIPDYLHGESGLATTFELKQQLREKWL
ncbi:MAG TPA: hypothetical protein VF571_09140 [Pyrinomonadaceae bacterium]|jgi:hypothetical protein